ncbi:MAG: hypothetical protein K1X85_01300 [Ignavibacteria bacterium]|nr:hypothetical protein [Ignavibacteria bacterium]
MKRYSGLLLIIAFTMISDRSISQSYNGAFFESFYGRYPGARSEALGRCGVSLIGDAFSHNANPASLGILYGGFAALAHSSDYYANPGAKFDYLSVAYSFGNTGTFGLIIEEIDPGWVDSSGIIPSVHELTALKTSYDRIYYARPVTEGLYWGIGITFLQPVFSYSPVMANGMQKEVDDFGTGFDVGLLKSFNFHSDKNFHQLNLGLSLSNIFVFPYESSALPSPIGLPSILRMGANYNFTENFKIQAGLTLEYEDNLNSDYYEAIRSGLELTFFEWLVLRAGYFAQDLRDCEDCNTSVSQFTYGFGIRIEKVPYAKFPMSVGIDASLTEQPPLQKKQISWGAAGMISVQIGIIF